MTDQNLEEKADSTDMNQDNTIPKYVEKIKDDPVIKSFENMIEKFPIEQRTLFYAIADIFYQRGASHGLIAGLINGADPRAAMTEMDDESDSIDGSLGLNKRIEKYVDYLEENSGLKLEKTQRPYYKEFELFLEELSKTLDEVTRKK